MLCVDTHHFNKPISQNLGIILMNVSFLPFLFHEERKIKNIKAKTKSK